MIYLLINKKAVKNYVRDLDKSKQVSEEFLNQLDYNLRSIVLRAVKNAKHFKRLKASELITGLGKKL